MDFRVGLLSTNLPAEIVKNLNIEDDLEAVLNNTISEYACSADPSLENNELLLRSPDNVIDSLQTYVTTDERDINNTDGSIILTYEVEELEAHGMESNPGVQILYINDGDTTYYYLLLIRNLLLMMYVEDVDNIMKVPLISKVNQNRHAIYEKMKN